MGRLTVVGITAILLLSCVQLEAKECTHSAPAGPPVKYDDYDDEFYPPPDNPYVDEFDWQLCKLLHLKEPGNVVLSPIGIKVLLVILYEAAEGKTAEELMHVLRVSSNKAEVRQRFHNVIKSLQECHADYSLELGTQVYASKMHILLRHHFGQTLRLFYEASRWYIDFSNTSETANVVNRWVNNSTHGRIPSVLNANDVNPSSILMLVNAIFFLGTWKYPFAEQNTKEDLFKVSPTKAVNVTYMVQNHYLYYSKSVEMDAKILRLPYRGKKYSMFLILPCKPDGLSQLLNKISTEWLRKHMTTMEPSNVHVKIPRFKLDYTVDLGETLKEMGLNYIFDERANLRGLWSKLREVNEINKASVYVSKVIQGAGIEVNENGTVAYSTTSTTIDNKFDRPDHKFCATHPFIFFIVDEITGVAVFMGKVMDPSAIPSLPTT